MQLGIIGYPATGKTTIFNILTNSEAPVGGLTGGGRIEFTSAMSQVPDHRLDKLSHLLDPGKTTCAQIQFSDVGGLNVQEGRAGLPNALLNQLAPVDGMIHVVRVFENDAIPHVHGSIDHQRDVEGMESDLILNDLLIVERKLQRLDEERGKGAREVHEIERERAIFERLHSHLQESKGLRCLDISHEDEHVLSGYGLLSRKPLLIILNFSEGQDPSLDLLPEGTTVIKVRGRLEMELGQMEAEEEQVFREEYGALEPARDVMIRAAYDLLSIISFFTYNERELRAWALKEGGTALQAAETIHSDIARGFIRAEVIAWDELVELGGLNQARGAGKLRIEGQDYLVKDGELIYIRFNV